jgi:hypothetical protein
MPVRPLLPALLLLAAAAVPAAQALGADAEATAGDLPVPNPTALPPPLCWSDEENLVPFVVDLVADCVPVGPPVVEYVDELESWLVGYYTALVFYVNQAAHDAEDGVVAYLPALTAWAAEALVTVNGDAIALDQYVVCRLVGPGDCGPVPPVYMPPSPPAPPMMQLPPSPPPPPTPPPFL